MSYIKSTLTKNEEIKYLFSFHWFEWVVPVLWCVLFPPIGLFLLLRVVFTEQGVTSKKGIKKVGIISRKTEELLLTKVETVEIKQGVLGRIFGFGNVQLTGTGNSYLVFRTISDPIKVKNNLESLIE